MNILLSALKDSRLFLGFMAKFTGGKNSGEIGFFLFFYLRTIINQTCNAYREAAGAEFTLFFASQQYSADQFPITCSDSPHFEEAALRLYYHSSSRQGLIKLTGVITRPPPCHCSERKMEQRCDGEGHEVINPAVCSMGFPCDTLSLQI